MARDFFHSENCRTAAVRVLLSAFVLLGGAISTTRLAAQAPAGATNTPEQKADSPADKSDAPAAPKQPERLDARCSDGSVLRVVLIDTKIPLMTDYGRLEIPATDVRRIDFATRISPAVQEQIKAAIANLGSEEYKLREAASEELQRLEHVAYPALLAAVEDKDPEVVRRADHLLEQLRKTSTQEDLQFQEYDVIYTDRSQFAGKIDLASLSVDTLPFGKQSLALTVLRHLGTVEENEPDLASALPDPGNLLNFQGPNNVGRTMYFRLSLGNNAVRNGFVWGTDVYTLDSSLQLAAVHAGVLKPGQSKVVGVTLLGPQAGFAGSVRNGIPSSDWATFPGGFRFKTKGAPAGGGGAPLRR